MNRTESAGSRGRAWSSSRKLWILGAMCAVCLMAIPAASGAVRAHSASTTELRSYKSKLGRMVTNAKLRTLYAFSRDGTGGKSYCYNKCAKVWPPILAACKTCVTAASRSGINKHKLGTIRRKDGTWQVTYWSQPLYRYIGDTKAGQHHGEYKSQFGGQWAVMGTIGSTLAPNGY